VFNGNKRIKLILVLEYCGISRFTSQIGTVITLLNCNLEVPYSYLVQEIFCPSKNIFDFRLSLKANAISGIIASNRPRPSPSKFLPANAGEW